VIHGAPWNQCSEIALREFTECHVKNWHWFPWTPRESKLVAIMKVCFTSHGLKMSS
jgi:hypothetical protein